MRIIKNAMKYNWFQLIVIIGINLALPFSSYAHHSWSEFSRELPIMIEGTVSKLEWKSPHARLYVDAIDENGEVVSWNFEMPSPNTMMRRGWTRKSLLPGDKVTVSGIRARNFPTIGIVTSILDENGDPMFTGSTPVY